MPVDPVSRAGPGTQVAGRALASADGQADFGDAARIVDAVDFSGFPFVIVNARSEIGLSSV